jgi:glutaredoxin
MRHQVILYHKPDCHLCHETADLLNGLEAELNFDWTTIDISSDPGLDARYSYQIPVIVIDSDFELSAPITERELRAGLKTVEAPWK